MFFLPAEMQGPLASVCCVGYTTFGRFKQALIFDNRIGLLEASTLTACCRQFPSWDCLVVLAGSGT
jgi:hypothetical protein